MCKLERKLLEVAVLVQVHASLIYTWAMKRWKELEGVRAANVGLKSIATSLLNFKVAKSKFSNRTVKHSNTNRTLIIIVKKSRAYI